MIDAKLTMTLENEGRTITIERHGHPSHWHLEYELKQMIAEVAKPTPGERMRQLLDDSRGVNPMSVVPWSQTSPASRATWEELARLAKRAAERGEL